MTFLTHTTLKLQLSDNLLSEEMLICNSTNAHKPIIIKMNVCIYNFSGFLCLMISFFLHSGTIFKNFFHLFTNLLLLINLNMVFQSLFSCEIYKFFILLWRNKINSKKLIGKWVWAKTKTRFLLVDISHAKLSKSCQFFFHQTN